MLTRRTLVTGLAALPLAGCVPSQPDLPTDRPTTPSAGGKVSVFVPGVMEAITKELGAAYARDGNGSASFEVGNTAAQRQQLATGATPEVWIAAGEVDMRAAAQANLVDRSGGKPLAKTKLVVIVAPESPAEIESLTDLAKPGVQLILGAKRAVLGDATDEVLTKVEDAGEEGFSDDVEQNVVNRETDATVIVNKVSMGEADAAIVFVSDISSTTNVKTVELSDADNTAIPLLIAPVTAGRNKGGGAAFIEFMLTGEGKGVLTKAGFLDS